MLAHLADVGECLNFSASERGAGNVTSAVRGGDVAAPYLWITCILGYVNSITNGFSLVVFILDKKNIIMRRLLLLLSLSETIFNLCLAVNFTVNLRVGSRSTVYESINAVNLVTGTVFTSFMLFNAFIMIRNWCLVMIAGSRCEVVRNPLSTRSGQVFSPQRTLIGYAIISVLSLLIYTPRLFEFTWKVYRTPCNPGNGSAVVSYLLTTQTHKKLDEQHQYAHYKTLLLFPMQTVVPIFLISGLSFLIIFTLRKRQFPQQVTSGAGSAASHRSQDAATKTVMVLLICFILFELPTFLFFVLNRTVFQSLSNFPAIRLHTTFIANIMVCLDSFSNFIVYSSTSNTFRETVRRVLRLPGAKGATNRGPISGNYTMIRSVNANLNLGWTANSAQSVRQCRGSAGDNLTVSPSPRSPSIAATPTLRHRGSSTPTEGNIEGQFAMEDSGFV